MRDNRPSVTLVVTTRDRPMILGRCLDRLAQLDHPVDAIVVADNDPSDQSALQIAERYSVSYRVERRRGLSRARNAGARGCKTELLCFIDDDMVAPRNWLTEMVRPFSDSSVDTVGCPVLPMELLGRPEAELLAWLFEWPRGPERFEIDRESAGWFERACFGGVVQGPIAFRTEAFRALGGFDERLGRGRIINHGEENFAALSLVARGGRVCYMPSAMVFHHDKPRDQSDVLEDLAQSFAYSLHVIEKHPSFALRIACYCAQAALGRTRRWRDPRGIRALGSAANVQTLGVISRGVAIYLRAVWEAVRSPSAAPEPCERAQLLR